MITQTPTTKSTATIEAVEITPANPKKMLFQAEIHALMSDGREKFVMKYYDDELSFTAEELCGLTIDEAHDLFMKKDIEYLQTP